MPNYFSTLRFRLILLVLLALLPAMALILNDGINHRNDAETHARLAALTLTRNAAEDQTQLIENTRQLLATLTHASEVERGDASACNDFLRSLKTQFQSIYDSLTVSDPNGNVICSTSSQTRLPSPPNNDWFKRIIQKKQFSVSGYVNIPSRGKSLLFSSYPLMDANGQVTGIVSAGIDLSWLGKLLKQAEAPPGSTLTVIDRRGTVLAHYPEPEKYVGLSVADTPIVKTILEQKAEGVVESRGADNVNRLYAFLPLDLTDSSVPDAYVYSGISTAVAYAEAEETMTRNLLMMGIVVLASFAATWFFGEIFLVQRVNQLVRATERLATGDLSARSQTQKGNGELSRLEFAFNQMAESLQQRDEERERAQNAIRQSEERFASAFRASPNPIMLNRVEDGLILDVNPAWCEMFGYSRQVAIGQTSIGLGITDQETRQKIVHALKKRGPIRNAEGSVTIRGGGQRNVLLSMESLDLHGESCALTYLIDITERKRSEEKIQAQIEQLGALRTIDQAIVGSTDLHISLMVILEQAKNRLSVDAAAVYLLDWRTQTLRCSEMRGFRKPMMRLSDVRLGEGITGKAALERRIVHVVGNWDSDHLTQMPEGEDFVTSYATPLIAKGKVVGVLNIFHRAPLKPDEDWITFMQALAGQAAIAIDNATLFNDLDRSHTELAVAYDATIEGWSRALDLRDKEAEGHSQRVTAMTLQLARAMGSRDEELAHMRRGALLHDIGKMGIPDAILLKPDKLTDEEWAIIRQHPQLAYDMLSPISYLRPALAIPYSHHEKWDGTGYPRGSSGEQIPLAARIFAVADVWDALRSDRPYRKAWSREATREYIRASSGTHFDPQVVKTFLQQMEPHIMDETATPQVGVHSVPTHYDDITRSEYAKHF